MQKRIWQIVLACLLTVGIISVGSYYITFVSKTIYNESSAHLTEIYHQTNQSLHNLVGNNFNTMEMWLPYLMK